MRWRVLILLSVAELLGMALWFSATAVVPSLATAWHLSDASKAWLTMSVQIGFVVGAFLSALFNVSDLVNTRYLFAGCAFAGALCNGIIGIGVDSIGPALILRFLTGVCLAGVYPPGMKIMATWFRESRGMAIGVLVGALTIGSASPHLLKVLGSPHWRQLMLMASLAAGVGGCLCLFCVREGPYQSSGARFDWRYIGRVFGDPGVRLANFGYFGHMWELYAVWTWIPLFLGESFQERGIIDAGLWSALGAFAVIGIGSVGCLGAGILADRYGRTTVTIGSMLLSGLCCLTVGLLYGGSPLLLLFACLLWGVVIVADSAQFSTSITELADPDYVGTALTLQTCLGFLLTLVSIRLLPVWVSWVSWQWAFAGLAVGPAFGVWSMYRLRQLPVAQKLGGEKQKT
ncbi:MAG: MFS transporter [Nitrospinota bacterium]|nr:MAG: MFS transporter [Nitrospinota bacterium]